MRDVGTRRTVRRREFLRRVIGGVAAVVGVPAALRARPRNPGLEGTLDELVVWPRTLSSVERTELYNAGAGLDFTLSINLCPTDLVGSNFFSRNFRTGAVNCGLPESATSTRTDEES